MSNLYETLGISPNATPEDVRKAYRRKALETHPDRMPQGASAAEKSISEDLFRKVNNAYEVLSDPQNRAAYDQHGVWPPPAPAPQGHFANGPHDPFVDPFLRDPFSRDPFFRGARTDPFSGFGFGPRSGMRGFTDPFVLFNSIFGDLHRAFEADPFFDDQFGRHSFEPGPFVGGFFSNRFPSMMPLPFGFNGGGMGSSRIQMSSSGGPGGRWVSESWSSSSVNGVTRTKCVRKDSEGNEHVTYRYPDGTERHTVNGVEQSASQSLRALPPSAPPPPPVPYSDQVAAMPTPYPEAVAHPPHHSRSSRHHVHYDDYPRDRREHRERHRHEYPSRDRRDHRDDKHGRDPQNSSSWNYWRS